MMVNLSPRYQRLSAIALLIFALALVWFALIAPIVSYWEDRSEKRQSDLRSLRRERALLALEPRIGSALESVDHSARWTRLYEGQKPERAILEMETDIRKLTIVPNNPTSMTAQGITVRGPFTRIAVKVTMSMPIDKFAETLDHLQSHLKFLELQNVVIQGPDYEAADSNPTLSIQADIAAYLLTPAAGT